MLILHEGPLTATVDEGRREIDVRINYSKIPEYPWPNYLEDHIDQLVIDLRPYLDKGFKLVKDFEEW